MKILTYFLLALLVMTLGASAVFYLNTFKPLAADYQRMAAGMPDLEKATAELKKYKEKEKQETAWISPVIGLLNAGLSDEIKAGKAEVIAAGPNVVVNVSEEALYMPGSYTFSKDSPQLRLKIVALLKSKEMKGKEIQIGNTAQDVPAQGKGRRKIPAKDARTLAADRSAVLIKYLENNSVEQDTLVAAAYSSKQPEIGFKIKDHKAVIIIKNPLITPMVAMKQEAAPQTPVKPAPETKSTSTSTAPTTTAPTSQSKTVPNEPAKPISKTGGTVR